jgi:hypothetical protein
MIYPLLGARFWAHIDTDHNQPDPRKPDNTHDRPRTLMEYFFWISAMMTRSSRIAWENNQGVEKREA